MRDFDERLLRLKQEAGIADDQGVAALLGLSKAAFSDRKRRNAFPEDKLLAAKVTRPDLNLDVAYVLTGERQAGHARTTSETLARFAGGDIDEEVRRLALTIIKNEATRDGARKDRYRLLNDLATHCDDQSFDLLLEIARTLVLVRRPPK